MNGSIKIALAGCACAATLLWTLGGWTDKAQACAGGYHNPAHHVRNIGYFPPPRAFWTPSGLWRQPGSPQGLRRQPARGWPRPVPARWAGPSDPTRAWLAPQGPRPSQQDRIHTHYPPHPAYGYGPGPRGRYAARPRYDWRGRPLAPWGPLPAQAPNSQTPPKAKNAGCDCDCERRSVQSPPTRQNWPARPGWGPRPAAVWGRPPAPRPVRSDAQPLWARYWDWYRGPRNNSPIAMAYARGYSDAIRGVRDWVWTPASWTPPARTVRKPYWY